MPSGPVSPIPYVMFMIVQYRPQSILELGVGFGKWGYLFREYAEITQSFDDHARYNRDHWKVRIDGIEGYEPYITPAHRHIYSNIYVGDFCKIIKTAAEYDVIFMGDVIEHVPKEKAFELLDDCLARAKKAVILTTPLGFAEQGSACGNEFERHQSGWSIEDFKRYNPVIIKVIEKNYLLVAILKPGVEYPLLNWHYHQQPMPKWKQLWRKCLAKILGWKLFTKYDNWMRTRIKNPGR